jgi:hypothetical protein
LETIEDDLHLAALANLLAAHARGLNRMFARAFRDMLLGKTRSFRDVGRALRAQNQCRIALRLLLALRAAEEKAKKSRNRTNKLLENENPHPLQDLVRGILDSLSCQDQTPPQRVVDERRAELIRNSEKIGAGSERRHPLAFPTLARSPSVISYGLVQRSRARASLARAGAQNGPRKPRMEAENALFADALRGRNWLDQAV